MYLEGCAASDGVEGEKHGRQLDRQERGAIVCSRAIRGLDYLHIGAVGQGRRMTAVGNARWGMCRVVRLSQ